LFSDIFSPSESFFRVDYQYQRPESGNQTPQLAKPCRVAARLATFKNKKARMNAGLLIAARKRLNQCVT